MATQKQRAAAKRNVKKAQAGNKVKRGQAKTRRELNAEAARLDIRGRSKMGKDQLRRAIQRAK
jgi:hypothetical protein